MHSAAPELHLKFLCMPKSHLITCANHSLKLKTYPFPHTKMPDQNSSRSLEYQLKSCLGGFQTCGNKPSCKGSPLHTSILIAIGKPHLPRTAEASI